MPAPQKIITKLRDRRRIEAELRNLVAASSELELRRQAQQVAALGPQVLPALVGNLERADAGLLMALGTVSLYLDRDEVRSALRRAVLQPQLSDQGRMAALTILERFLGEPPDDDLLTSLSDPEGAAVSSLEEVLAQAARNPAVLIEYVQGLDRQEPEIVVAVVHALRGLAADAPEQGRRTVEPLRMMAQDVREEIAAEAVQALGALRSPEAARALQTLIPVTPPTLRPQAERALRKLRFAGVPVEELPPPDARWRALVGPVDGRGQQGVWFMLESRLTARARFLNVLLSDRAGAYEAVGHSQVPVQMLPPRRPPGHLHDITLPDGSGAMLMLEVAFDVGRQLILRALVDNWRTQIPVAGALRLLSPWLWEVEAPAPAPLPQPAAVDPALMDLSDRLLDHPAFATWIARGEPAILQAAEEALRHPGWDREVWVRRLAGELFEDPAVAQVISRRLATMGEWLSLSGDETRARLALVAAGAFLEGDVQELAFAQALVRRDLELALESLEQNPETVK